MTKKYGDTSKKYKKKLKDEIRTAERCVARWQVIIKRLKKMIEGLERGYEIPTNKKPRRRYKRP